MFRQQACRHFNVIYQYLDSKHVEVLMITTRNNIAWKTSVQLLFMLLEFFFASPRPIEYKKNVTEVCSKLFV